MKTMQNRLKIWLLRAALVLILPIGAHATILYVNVNSTNSVPPYSSWATAATNIQSAVPFVNSYSDLVLVTNGIYPFRPQNSSHGANLYLPRNVTVQSVNGPEVTIIMGTNGPHAARCVYMDAGTSLSGFTLSNGATTASNPSGNVGGGVYMDLANMLSNCIIVNNTAQYGGGIFADLGPFTLVINCKFIGNTAQAIGSGGGAFIEDSRLKFLNCIFSGNTAGAYGGAMSGGTLINCTVVGNTAQFDGIDGGGSGGDGCTLENCIAYYNSPDNGESSGDNVSFYNCCVAALPTTNSVNNFTNAPLFADLANGDYHLSASSPCINAGKNSYTNSYITVTNDLDGNPRVVGGTVDLGAYEFQSPSSTLSYVWAQQYGIPTDGSADNLDPDGDGMSNYAEWKTGTDPKNPLSLLQMNSVAVTNVLTGATITWQSVSNMNYFVQRGLDLSATPVFTTIASNIVGQGGTTSYNDATATNSVPYFYRVGVQ